MLRRGTWREREGRRDRERERKTKNLIPRRDRRYGNAVTPISLVDGEGLGLENNEVRGLGGFEVLENETPLGERAPVLLTLVFREEGHLWWGILVSLGDPGKDRATQACVASRSPPASSVHLSGALCELHHVEILPLEFLLVIVAVGLEIPDDLVKGLGSLA